MSVAGKASGQASARIATSCAVQSPMPGSARGLALLSFDGVELPGVPDNPSQPWLAQAARELARYWQAPNAVFSVPLDMQGTEFQRRVWTALTTIPSGVTVSYRDIATRIGQPSAVRAVGLANGANPVALIVPCHRVIGRDGTLTGYAGGLQRKAALLRHESVQKELAA
jgi:methylated-DNA-[protein]-cysteine S-methyltransferase